MLYRKLIRQIRFAESLAELEKIMETATYKIIDGDEFLDIVCLCHYKANELRFC